MKRPVDKESILYAFAVEANHDRSTLERYLREFPEIAEELIDLSSELRVGERLVAPSGMAINDPAFADALKEFLAIARQQATAIMDPFARYQGIAFADLANSLAVPRSLLTALRDGLVVPSSISNGFLCRFAIATQTTVDSIRAYLSQPRQSPTTRLAFKSDQKPSSQGQMSFRQLIQNTQMTDEQRSVLLRECDEDGRD